MYGGLSAPGKSQQGRRQQSTRKLRWSIVSHMLVRSWQVATAVERFRSPFRAQTLRKSSSIAYPNTGIERAFRSPDDISQSAVQYSLGPGHLSSPKSWEFFVNRRRLEREPSEGSLEFRGRAVAVWCPFIGIRSTQVIIWSTYVLLESPLYVQIRCSFKKAV